MLGTTKRCIECNRFRPVEEFMRRWDQPEDEEVTVCIICNVAKDMAADREKERLSAQQPAKKACKKCKETKALTEFNRRTKADDGLQTWCRVCTTEASREYVKKKKAAANRSAAQKRRWEKEKAEEEQVVAAEEVLDETLIVNGKPVPVTHTGATDPVNSPNHYRTGGIECIDAMVQVFGDEAVRTYARINAFKYIWRHNYKGKPQEDLAKAAWYTRFANGDDPRKEGKQ